MLRVPATGSAALQMLKAAWQLLDKSDGGSAFRNFVQGLFAGARGYPLIELWRFTFKPQAVIQRSAFLCGAKDLSGGADLICRGRELRRHQRIDGYTISEADRSARDCRHAFSRHKNSNQV
jgi:hypothetical protein